jgi:hypothetical protein
MDSYSFIAPNGARVTVSHWSSLAVKQVDLARAFVFNDKELF